MNCYTTSTGIRIGCAHQRPLSRELGVHAEIMQTVLLAKPGRSWLARIINKLRKIK